MDSKIVFVILVSVVLRQTIVKCQDGDSPTEGEDGLIDSDAAKDEDGFKDKVIDYAVLNLDTDLLRGSRWAIEQAKKKDPIEVFHAIEIVDISKVDVQTMSVRVELHFRQRWSADDLKLPNGLFKPDDPNGTFIRTDPEILDSLWSPDSYIPMARDTKISQLTNEAAVVNIFPNRTIVFKGRMFTILGCAFSFQWYPLDRQNCELNIESYTSSNKMVRYRWERYQPVTFNNLKLLQYDIQLPMKYTNGSASRWGRSEKYPYVQLLFSFERQIGHHLIQVFIPTILVVCLSYFSFWLGLDAIPGRISLLITCMLTMVTMHSTQKGGIPPVNYIKMMDIWMVGCMLIIFIALCEFAVVKYLHWEKQRQEKAAAEAEKQMLEFQGTLKRINPRNHHYHTQLNANKSNYDSPDHPYLDFYSRKRTQQSLDGPGAPFHSSEISNSGSHWQLPELMVQTTTGEYVRLIDPNGNYGKQYSNGFGGSLMKPTRKPRPIWVTIDIIFRILFPVIFIIFNAVFWPVLIIGAANQS